MSVFFHHAADGDGTESFASLSLLVGAEWSVSANTYTDRPPILTVATGRLHLSLAPAGGVVSAGQLEFAHALAAAAGEYLIECDRIALENRDIAAEDSAEESGGAEPLAA